MPNLQVHIHEMHKPGALPLEEERLGIGSAVLVHRRSDDKFLMVSREWDLFYARSQSWLEARGFKASSFET